MNSIERGVFFDILKDCRINNWDGYNALALEDAALEQARRFLRLTLKKFPIPMAMPLPSGSLALEWITSKNDTLIVIFHVEDQITYHGILGSGTVRFFGDELPVDILYQLTRLFESDGRYG